MIGRLSFASALGRRQPAAARRILLLRRAASNLRRARRGRRVLKDTCQLGPRDAFRLGGFARSGRRRRSASFFLPPAPASLAGVAYCCDDWSPLRCAPRRAGRKRLQGMFGRDFRKSSSIAYARGDDAEPSPPPLVCHVGIRRTTRRTVACSSSTTTRHVSTLGADDFGRPLRSPRSRRRGGRAGERSSPGSPDVVLLDVKMPGVDGLRRMSTRSRSWPSRPAGGDGLRRDPARRPGIRLCRRGGRIPRQTARSPRAADDARNYICGCTRARGWLPRWKRTSPAVTPTSSWRPWNVSKRWWPCRTPP